MKRLFLSLALALGIFAIPLPSFATVNSTIDKVIYNGDGISYNFSFNYNVYLVTDLSVYTTVVATGVTTQLTLNTNYGINLSPVSGTVGAYTATVNLTAGSSPFGVLPVGTQLVILRSLPLTQLINISDYSATPAATWNQAFDRTVILIQQMQEQLNRSLLGPVNSNTTLGLPGAVVGDVIGWGAGGVLANFTPNTATYFNLPIPISQGGTGSTAAANAAGGVVVPTGAVNAASGAVVLNGSSQLPAVSGALLTSLPVFTTQNVVTGSRNINTSGSPNAYVYQNTTGKTMIVTVSAYNSGGVFAQWIAYSDNASSPTTIVVQAIGLTAIEQIVPMTFLVLPNNYYKVTAINNPVTLAIWTEWY
jgi:hypothetical protein